MDKRTPRSRRKLVHLGILGFLLLALGVTYVVYLRLQVNIVPPTYADALHAQTHFSDPPPLSADDTEQLRRTSASESKTLSDERVHTGSGLPSPPVNVRGQILDVDGRPLVGLGVVETADSDTHNNHIPEPLTHTDATGGYAVSLALASPITLGVADQRYVTAEATRVTKMNASYDHTIIAAPGIRVSGVVVDAQDRPLDKAIVTHDIPVSALGGIVVPLDNMVATRNGFRTSESGTFTLNNIPSIRRSVLTVDAADFDPITVPAPVVDTNDLRLMLRAKRDRAPVLYGRVVDKTEAPVAGVRVLLGASDTTSDNTGYFSLPVALPVSAGWSLVAIKEGYRPFISDAYGTMFLASDNHPAPAHIVLDNSELAIRGVVVNHNQEPMRRWLVRVADGTRLPEAGFLAPSLEDMYLGSGQPPQLTSDAGEFVIRGLLDREYTLVVSDPISLCTVRSQPVKAGSASVSITVPSDALAPKLSGQVVSYGGIPLESVAVGLVLITAGDPNSLENSRWIQGPTAVTNPTGFFEFHNVPRADVQLNLTGNNIIPQRYSLDSYNKSPGEIKITVAERRYFHFISSLGAGSPLVLEVLGQSDERLPLYILRSNVWIITDSLEVPGEEFPTVAVSELARTLVVYRDKIEIRRVKLSLEHGQVGVVRV
jgi:hypothetical protein